MEGAALPTINFGPPHILETITARKLKFYTFRYSQVHFLEMKFFLLGCLRGAVSSSANLGPLRLISRKLLELES